MLSEIQMPHLFNTQKLSYRKLIVESIEVNQTSDDKFYPHVFLVRSASGRLEVVSAGII